uniref:Reverse transcriptase domain-containing protein n=1 Tax=Amphimedon queenslandica TaxID=400682 RepID=A0A1X7TD05_AMPQE
MNVFSLKNSLLNKLVQRWVTPLEVDKTLIAGRLALFEDNWSKISQDIWILNTLRGYKIEFWGNPTQQGQPRVGLSSTPNQTLLNEEIQKMLTKGAISEIPLRENPQGYYSSLYLVPKKDGGKRPVINLKDLNAYIPSYHFNMEGLHSLLRDILKEGDWMTKWI